jgi:hypothetical protein
MVERQKRKYEFFGEYTTREKTKKTHFPKIWKRRSNYNREYKKKTPGPMKPILRCSAPSIKRMRIPASATPNFGRRESSIIQFATNYGGDTRPNCGGKLGNI